MIYCILGMIILFGNSEEAGNLPSTTITSGKSMSSIYCDVLSISKVYCGVHNKFTTVVPTIPIDKFPKQMKTLDGHFMIAGGWQIKDERMFQNFENLTEIRLTGPVQFTSPYNEGTMKTQLMNELFNLPKLRMLNLLYWDLRDFNSWRFPVSLRTLIVQKCGLSYLDLSWNSNLNTLNLVSNSLTKMPKLSNPLPPLQHLVLSNNPSIQFTVDDIVNLCHLKELGITQFNSLLSPNQRYCECVRLKNYMEEFDIAEYDPFNCEDLNSTIDCSDYTLEFVRSIRENKCSNSTLLVRAYADNEGTPIQFTTSWIQEHQFAVGIGFLLVVSLLANVVLFVVAIRSGEQDWDSSASMIEEEGAET